MSNDKIQRSLKQMIRDPKVEERFQKMLGDNATSFLMSVMSVTQNNKMLATAEPESVLMAAARAATIALPIDPNLSQACIVPYKEKGVVKAQFQIMWRGLVQLGHRSQQFVGINVDTVHDGEYKGTDRLTGEHFFEWIQDNDERKKVPVIGYVAYFKLLNGFAKSSYMTKAETLAHGKKYSKSFSTGNWTKDFDGMSKKTVLKLLLDKFAPKSVEMQKAIESDQGIFDADGTMSYADNPTNDVIDLDEHNAQKERDRVMNFIKLAKDTKTLSQCYEHIPDDDVRKLYDDKMAELAKLESKSKN